MVDNLEWYKVFYITALSGSFSHAAEQLFITQPAVTHTIIQLETKHKGQLFFRTSRVFGLQTAQPQKRFSS